MNILIINYYYYPNIIGGTENSVKYLAEGLVAKGHNVAVYTFDSKTSFISETINGVKIFRDSEKFIEKNSLFFRIIRKVRYLWNYSYIQNVLHVVNEFKPDIVNTNNLFGISTTIWRLFHKLRIPIIHTLRDYSLINPITTTLSQKKWLYKPYCSLFSHMVSFRSNRCVSAVTAPSKMTLTAFIQRGFFKNSVQKSIPNGIEIDLSETINIISKKENRISPIITFLYVGGLTEEKGVNVLLEAFNKLSTENAKLTICGSGSLDTIVYQHAKEDSRISYLGQLNMEELTNRYIESDVLVVPSIWDEPFGRVLIEGSKYGLPIITTNQGGIKEIMDTLESGVTYSCNSSDELVDKMKLFLERNLIKSYYKNIIANISAYDINKNTSEYLKLYELLLRFEQK